MLMIWEWTYTLQYVVLEVSHFLHILKNVHTQLKISSRIKCSLSNHTVHIQCTLLLLSPECTCVDIMIQFIASTEGKTQGNDGEVDSPGSALFSNITLYKEHMYALLLLLYSLI